MDLNCISTKFTIQTLDEIVKKAGGTKYLSHKFDCLQQKGESYLSKVFKLKVIGLLADDTDKNINSTIEIPLIIKAMPNNLNRRRVFRSVDFFRNEYNFYTKIIPAWEKFQQLYSPKQPFKDYPICFAAYCDGENDFIALEDLTPHGYNSFKRQGYISLEECFLALRTLGRFHGMSLAFKTLQPEEFHQSAAEIEETYYSEKCRDWYQDFLTIACMVAKNAIEHCYPHSKYLEKAISFLQPKKLYDDLIYLVTKKSKLSVISHGDCWIMNFLIHQDNQSNKKTGSPELHLKMIDFQLVRHASLALDISFLIYSCTSQTLRELHYMKMLKAYHEAVIEILGDFGIKNCDNVISWQSLLTEMEQFARFGCGMGIESLPMSLLEHDEISDLDEIGDNTKLDDVWNLKPFKEFEKQKRIADIFKHAIDLNYI